MAVKLWRPFVTGMVGLTLVVWLLESLNHSIGGVGTLMILSAAGVGLSMWWVKPRSPAQPDLSSPSPIDRTVVEQAITETETVLNQLQTEAASLEQAAATTVPQQQLRSQVAQVAGELDRKELRLTVMGGKAVGKTTLMQVLESGWLPQVSQTVILRDAPALFDPTEAGLAAETMAWKLARTSDLVLFVTTGDLTEPELQAIRRLVMNRKRTLLVLNKQDQYLPSDRQLLRRQLQQRTQRLLSSDDIVAIATAPNPIKVRQQNADQSLQEWIEQPAPDVANLTDRLTQIVSLSRDQLVLATCLTQVAGLKTEAQTALKGVRRVRSLPVIERYQWIAAGTTLVNPLPALDLVATAAINTKMVLELSTLYQQTWTIAQAQAVATSMAGLMLKLGLVELSTQAIAGMVLKSNAVTYLAGGLLQGVSAAYLTRMAGLSLVTYFQELETGKSSSAKNPLHLERMSQILQAVFQQTNQLTFLQSFVKQAVERLAPSTPVAPPPPEFDLLPAEISPPLQLVNQSPENLSENREAEPIVLQSLDPSSVPST